jgi:isopenicillin N synthase-like dioxygenase
MNPMRNFFPQIWANTQIESKLMQTPHISSFHFNYHHLQIMTNGKFKSIEHRVIINAHKERLSVSAFHNPKFDGVVSPATATPTEKLLYRTVKVEDYIKHSMSNKLDGKRALDHAKAF